MTAVVFLGPTLPAAEAMARLPCTLLPPAGQGDVFRAVRDLRPRAIGLIDGVFLSARPVWHREILWALDQGVAVFGAASMGALRAAELFPFGMRGVGRVFEAFRDGRWPGEEAPFEDDDEVAVVHAPAELGAGALSDAMVDLRDTLAAAAAAGVIDGDARLRLTGAMKALHFPDRSFLRLAEMAAQLLPAGRAQAFSDFLADGIVPRKRLDARALLDAIAAFLAGPSAERPDFVFQQAQVWERFYREEQVRDAVLDAAAVAVLDELRLDPAAWRAASLAVCARPADDATAAVCCTIGSTGFVAPAACGIAPTSMPGWRPMRWTRRVSRGCCAWRPQARRRCRPRRCRRCSITSASPAGSPRCWTGPGASRRCWRIASPHRPVRLRSIVPSTGIAASGPAAWTGRFCGPIPPATGRRSGQNLSFPRPTRANDDAAGCAGHAVPAVPGLCVRLRRSGTGGAVAAGRQPRRRAVGRRHVCGQSVAESAAIRSAGQHAAVSRSRASAGAAGTRRAFRPLPARGAAIPRHPSVWLRAAHAGCVGSLSRPAGALVACRFPAAGRAGDCRALGERAFRPRLHRDRPDGEPDRAGAAVRAEFRCRRARDGACHPVLGSRRAGAAGCFQ